MPPRRKKTKRCEYREGRIRCPSNGTGEPCLCAPHRIVLMDAARAARAASPFDGLYGLFEDFVAGRRIAKKKVEAVLDEIVNGFVPPQGWHPPAWQQQMPPNGRQQQQRTTSVPDQQLEAVRRARITLGFAESERPDAATIKARQRKLAMKNHPDRGGNPDRMAEINSAVDVLLDGI